MTKKQPDKDKSRYKPKTKLEDVPDFTKFEATRYSNFQELAAERVKLSARLKLDKARLEEVNIEMAALMTMAGHAGPDDRMKCWDHVWGVVRGASPGRYDKMKAVEEGEYDVETVEGVFKAAYVPGKKNTHLQAWPVKEYDPDKEGGDE